MTDGGMETETETWERSGGEEIRGYGAAAAAAAAAQHSGTAEHVFVWLEQSIA